MTNTLHTQIQIGTCVQIQIGERQWARFVSRWCQTCPFATQLYSLVYILLFTITCPSAIRTALQYQHHLHCFRCLLDIYIYTVFMGDVQLLEFHWNPFFEAVSHNHLHPSTSQSISVCCWEIVCVSGQLPPRDTQKATSEPQISILPSENIPPNGNTNFAIFPSEIILANGKTNFACLTVKRVTAAR